MDEALRWLRRIAMVLALPFAAAAALLLVLVVAALFYLRAMAVGAWSILGMPFRFPRRSIAPSLIAPPLSGPHFQDRVPSGQNVTSKNG